MAIEVEPEVVVEVQHTDTGEQILVTVPRTTTVKELKATLSKETGNLEIARKGRLVVPANGGEGVRALQDKESVDRIYSASTGKKQVILRNAELVPPPPKYEGPPPILVLFYSAGMDPRAGRAFLADVMGLTDALGVKDTVVMDYINDKEYRDCKDFDAYVMKMARSLEQNALYGGRPFLFLAHSMGCIYAWGLARHMGERVKKLYIFNSRHPFFSVDDAWGCSSVAHFARLDDKTVLGRLCEAWQNHTLELYKDKDQDQFPSMVNQALNLVRDHYGDRRTSIFSEDLKYTLGNPDYKATCPILCFASEDEKPNGETIEKVDGWRNATSGDFKVCVVPGDHFDSLRVVGGTWPAGIILARDLRAFIPAKAALKA